jgi:hypothetical protein
MVVVATRIVRTIHPRAPDKHPVAFNAFELVAGGIDETISFVTSVWTWSAW